MYSEESEINRILFSNNLELPKNDSHVIYEIDNIDESDYYDIKKVIGAVSQFKKENWPDEEEWSKILPERFVTETKKNTLEAIRSNPKLYLWHYGSWLNSIKYRNWVWFSSKYSKIDAKASIVLITIDFPYIIECFEYVIRNSSTKYYKYIEYGMNSKIIMIQNWKNNHEGWTFENQVF